MPLPPDATSPGTLRRIADALPLIEQSPVGITITRNGTLTYVNQAAVEIFGYSSREELEGLGALDVVAPESRELVGDRMMRRLRGEDVPDSYDYVALRRDGSAADVHMEVVQLDFPDGPALIAYHMDVTERRRAERALRESEARFRNMADHAPIVMRVTDASGNCTYLNQPWYEFTGQSEEASRGAGWLEAIHPDDRMGVEAGLADAIAHRRGVQLEYRLRRADGVYRWVFDSAAARLDDAGAFLGYVASVVDIDERREAELANARLAAIVQSSDDAIVSKTLDGTVMSWNEGAVRIFGYEPAEMIGASILQLIPPERHEEERRVLERVSRGESVARIETERIRKGGARITIELSVSPVKDRSGRIVGAASIKRDVTERRRAEQQLRQAAKMEAIGRVAGGLAHDFNNQLHALRGFADFVARDPNLGPTAREDLHQVQRAGDRMASLTRQLLAFSRRQVLTPETVDLDSSVSEMQPMLQRLIGSNIEMQVERSPGAKWVQVDPAQLLQVVMNLAINARDAMPAGGRLVMRTGIRRLAAVELGPLEEFALRPGEYATLSVTDSGTGIDPTDLPQIFEPFFTTKGIGEGTGLGLPTVHGIVTQSHGAIQVESTVGEGTTFTIYLPVSSPPAPRPSGRDRASGTHAAAARVLVVDDEDLVREVAARSLEQGGFHVQRARHGREALQILETGPRFDLVLSDVVMPVMGGRELGQRLASIHPDLPIIWMSGHPREALSDIVGTAEEGRYLQKPVAPDVLVGAVRRVLHLHGRRER
ncbi:MAG TPA: PAS domain S-box protein [Gemmatimonadales bacterium]|nr:PAS domain S-box protein [Gemmatimonadales bacterium]